MGQYPQSIKGLEKIIVCEGEAGEGKSPRAGGRIQNLDGKGSQVVPAAAEIVRGGSGGMGR